MTQTEVYTKKAAGIYGIKSEDLAKTVKDQKLTTWPKIKKAARDLSKNRVGEESVQDKKKVVDEEE